MNYGNFRRLVLEHIDQYSVAGVPIPDTYNNQADDSSRIPGLTNIALRTIATQYAPLRVVIDPMSKEFGGTVTDMGNGWTKIKMPTDFYKMDGRGNPCMVNGELSYSMSHWTLTDDTIMVRSDEIPGMMLSYHRYPRKVSGHYEEILDCTDQVADCISYYVAAMLAREDDAYGYQTLYNEYLNNLAMIKKPMTAELSPVMDVYNCFNMF